MDASELSRAVRAAMYTTSALNLEVNDAVVLNNSNRLAVRLLPCDTLARVAPITHQRKAMFELEIARRLAENDSPVARVDPRVEPRVYLRDGFVVTLWTYYESMPPSRVAPREYARALERLHAGMRRVDMAAPHFTDRVAEAQHLVDNPTLSPELPDADRELLSNTLRSLGQAIVDRGATEQLLHGEPHPGNLLRTEHGLLFMDLETCCFGPVEFDVAHCSQLPSEGSTTSWHLDAQMPQAVSEHYPAVDPGLTLTCWVLMLAMVAAWRWDRDDQFPGGRRMGEEFVAEVREALERYGLGIQR